MSLLLLATNHFGVDTFDRSDRLFGHQPNQLLLTAKVTDFELLAAPTRAGIVAAGEFHVVTHRLWCLLCGRFFDLCLLCSHQSFELFSLDLAQRLFVLERNVNDLIHHVTFDIGFELVKQRIRRAPVFDQRVTLGYCLQANLLAQVFHAGQIIRPMAVDDTQHHSPFDVTHGVDAHGVFTHGIGMFELFMQLFDDFVARQIDEFLFDASG